MKYLIPIIFVCAALFLPSLVLVPLAVFVATTPLGPGALVIAGVLRDGIYGTPIPALGNFQFVYTSVFLCAALVALAIQRRVMD